MVTNPTVIMEEYTPSNAEELTCCEKKVLILMAAGLKTKAIADTLFRSVHTIKNHKTNICKKMNFKNVQELYVFAALNATMLQAGGG